MTKTCKDCGIMLHIDFFPVFGKDKKPRPRCTDCHRAYDNDMKRKHYDTEKNRALALKRKYGLSLEDYNKMFLAQRGLCAVCEEPEITLNRDGSPRFLAVDHDHNCCPGQVTCGKCVRSLLCYKCNCLLGNAQDNVDTLKRAVAYLEDNR